MTITPIKSPIDTANIPVEELAGNKSVTEQQKVAEASRQFEAIMLRQILSESQKPVITSEFTDNSTAAGIYQDYITNTLADSMSKSGTFGFAKIFDQQLSHPAPKTGKAGENITSSVSQKPVGAVNAPLNFDKKDTRPVSAIRP
jgi:Rod binding domain-containing protein